MSRPTTAAVVGSLVMLAAALTMGCLYRSSPAVVDDNDEPPAGRRLTEIRPEVRDMVTSDNDFAADLYARLSHENRDQNLFFSPYSVSSALTMVAEGARGETAGQMGKVLRYPDAARRKGDDAREQPWDMERIHAGMAALNDHFAAGNRPAPRAVRERLADLRKQLGEANERSEQLERKGDWKAQQDVFRKAQRLADEINKLQGEYNQYELRVANALWGEKSYAFRKTYLETLEKHYHTGGLYPVDFRNDFEGARKRINAWVEKQTHDRIKDMLPRDVLDEEAKKLVRLILTNAIYFKGEWQEVFQKELTKDDDFLLAGGKKARVKMMVHNSMKETRYAAFRGDGTPFDTPAEVALGEKDEGKLYPGADGFQLLELPYKGGEVSMAVLVPRSADGLPALEKKLTGANLAAWIGRGQKREVHVSLPRFKLETKYSLENTLQGMGMVRAFRDPRLADGAQFDGISESTDPLEKLYISKVLHKAFVEVNEKGTEAAAATAVIMAKPLSAPVSVPFVPVFRADRPFVFLIRDVKTGSILFLGRMTNPAQGA